MTAEKAASAAAASVYHLTKDPVGKKAAVLPPVAY